MKKMYVPRGTARAKRRQSIPMLPPSAAARAQQAIDQARLTIKMSAALFHKHGSAQLPF